VAEGIDGLREFEVVILQDHIDPSTIIALQDPDMQLPCVAEIPLLDE
jgi:hypothetical protein